MVTSFEFLAAWLRARFGADDRGASLVEYALLISFIALVCFAAVTFLGNAASSRYNSVGSSLANNN